MTVSFVRSSGERWNGTVTEIGKKSDSVRVDFINENGEEVYKSSIDIRNLRTPMRRSHQKRTAFDEEEQARIRREAEEKAKRQAEERARRQVEEERVRAERARRQAEEERVRAERARLEVENRIKETFMYDDNPYELLSISSNSSPEMIKKAFRRQAQKWHPDCNKDPIATKRFQKIKAAYDLLKNMELKNMYDELYPAYQ